MHDYEKRGYGGYPSRTDILKMRKQATQKWLASLRKNHR